MAVGALVAAWGVAWGAWAVARRLTGRPMWGLFVAGLWWPLGAAAQGGWLAAAAGLLPAMGGLVAGTALLAAALEAPTRPRRRLLALAAGLAYLAADLSYEQVWFLSLLAAYGVGRCRRHPLILPAVSAGGALGLTALWYGTHLGGLVADGKLPNLSLGAVVATGHALVPQLAELFGAKTTQALTWGFTQPGPWPTGVWVVVGGLALVGAWAAWAEYPRAAPPPGPDLWRLWGFGWAWVAVAYLPWLLTRYDWVSERALYPAFPGLGLLLDGVLGALGARLPATAGVGRAVVRLGLAAAVVGLWNGHAQDLWAYRQAAAFDGQLAQLVYRAFRAEHPHYRTPLAVRIGTMTFVPWDAPYHDHIRTTWYDAWGPHLMLYDLSHGRWDPPVLLWRPGEPAPSQSVPLAVVLTRAVPRPTLCPTTARTCLVLRVQDTELVPRLAAVRRYRTDSGPPRG